jgi:hypothetical protein
METTDVLKAVAAMQPIVERLVVDLERADVPGPVKRQQALDLAGAIYEGARRTGALDGVKEVRGLDWSLVAPLIGLLVDGLVTAYKALGLFLSKRTAAKVAP